jgi:hypothetical protein
MTGLWRFLHFLSFLAWIGGGLAALVTARAMARLERPFWGGIADVQGAIYRTLIGPGAMVSMVTGLLLTFRMYGALSGQVGAWLGAMQLLGVLGTLVTLLVAMPAASRLSRAEPTGATAATFDALQRRVVTAGSLSTGLALLALLAGALYRS